jgi:protoheme IX farnesyltransferase
LEICLKESIKIFFELTKIRITSFVALTTAFGYIAYARRFDVTLFYAVIGILFLACGSAAFNHFQERNYDSLMDRTKSRPLPSDKISKEKVFFISAVLVIAGSLILGLLVNLLALGLAVVNLFWYNVVYTLLKRKTPFAIIPGSLVGAIPPAVGWAAAGGYIFDPQIIIISFFFFIWQIPHFWLLLLLFDKDYRKAGFPTLTQIFNRYQLSSITFIWILATAVTGLLIPLYGLVTEFWINISLFLSSVWLTWLAFKLLTKTENNSVFRFTFRYINLFVLAVVFLVSLDKLVH